MTQHCCPNLVFPSALESALSAANSSTLVSRSTLSTGSRGRGSQETETTSERDKPSSKKHAQTLDRVVGQPNTLKKAGASEHYQ
ncbi:hypothetical protein Taro_054814 [Colocasia esculenta]|uniref:Uncharacterized protein n=1 Tax=Colocasia esculenta TaxID=4460 RepID=A0A843XPW2_COLES|nr:hypothetical protein [Colocasia esculenta]